MPLERARALPSSVMPVSCDGAIGRAGLRDLDQLSRAPCRAVRAMVICPAAENFSGTAGAWRALFDAAWVQGMSLRAVVVARKRAFVLFCHFLFLFSGHVIRGRVAQYGS